MRISVWEQFSSNHSASFTVVGQFQDAEAAYNAADEIRQAAKSIADWYSAHEAIQDAVIQGAQETPTDAELQVCQTYGISCERSLDWLANCGYSEQIVRVYDNCVFVTNRIYVLCEGWSGEALFDQLMAKLALRTFVEESNSFAALVTIACTAPEVAAAQSIHDTVADYLPVKSGEFNSHRDIPWIRTYLRKQKRGDETMRDYPIYLARRRAEKQWDETHKGELLKLYEQAGFDFTKSPPSAEMQPIQEEFCRMKERDLASVEALDQKRQIPITLAVADVGADIPWWSKGDVEARDRQISIRGISLFNIAAGLPIVIEWLTEQGCTGITYQFEQH